MRSPHIRVLDKQIDTVSFSCGQVALDAYIQHFASQDVRRNVARVFVASPQDALDTLAGFYTLSAASVQCSDLPASIARKLPQYPIPVALLGRLAVSTAHQGQGLGAVLVIDACKKVRQAHAMLAVEGLVVDAKDQNAARFYKHLGFSPLSPLSPLSALNHQVQRFFLSMPVLHALAR
jgi:GNAT superfamily N-acetyltransferase